MKFGTVTRLAPYWGQTVKISNFSKTKLAAAAILKITKIAISFQQFDRSLRNLPSWPLKNLNFQNPRWRTAAILKTVKSSYLWNRLTDFDEIWHDDADWPPTGYRPLKFRTFQKTKMAAVVILKNHINRDITTRD